MSLGANLGARLEYLRLGVTVLQPFAVSPVFETTPMGGVPQADYLNAVVLCDCDATEAWRRAQEAERRAERRREVRWGPRTLDVDMVVADGPAPDGVLLPHPRAHQRAFVLLPWLSVQPDAQLPGYGGVAHLLERLDVSAVRRREDLSLW